MSTEIFSMSILSTLSILFRAAQLPMTIQPLKIVPIKLVQIVKINEKKRVSRARLCSSASSGL